MASSSSQFAIVFILVVLFTSLLTRRMLITTDVEKITLPSRGKNYITDTIISIEDALLNRSTSNHVPVTSNEQIAKRQRGTKKKAADHEYTSSQISSLVNVNTSDRGDFHEENISPQPGTDISVQHQISLLQCHNQSRCIRPQLQLAAKTKVYFCKHPSRHGIRFYYLVRDGLLLHPNVELVHEDNISSAEFIVYLPGSSPWHLTECANASYANRLIVLDEFDGYTIFLPFETYEQAVEVYGKDLRWYFTYFKRSFVARKDGLFLSYPHLTKPDVFPMTYSIAQAYIPHTFTFQREIDILCTLRGSKKMTTRQRVQDWIAEYAMNKTLNVISGEVNGQSRATVSKQYFQQMYNAKIIVTVNPANWEGDFRLWESMCTGALVFVDPLFVPHAHPLLDGVHVVYFSNVNKTELTAKLDYYLAHPVEARRIAVEGYLHAMKYHRTLNTMDYVLRTSLAKKSILKSGLHFEADIAETGHESYTFTGQQLNKQTEQQLDEIKRLNRPGVFTAS